MKKVSLGRVEKDASFVSGRSRAEDSAVPGLVREEMSRAARAPVARTRWCRQSWNYWALVAIENSAGCLGQRRGGAYASQFTDAHGAQIGELTSARKLPYIRRSFLSFVRAALVEGAWICWGCEVRRRGSSCQELVSQIAHDGRISGAGEESYASCVRFHHSNALNAMSVDAA